MGFNDPSEEVFRGKLEKSYRTDCPIELLCYTGRTGVSDDICLATLRRLATTHGLGPFRRVWFLGGKSCELVAWKPSARPHARSVSRR